MAKRFRIPLFESFQCLGPDCPDTCCQHWRIDYNETPIEKLKARQSEPLAIRALDAITEFTIEDKSRKVIQLNAEGFCPLLDEQSLCSVHAALGPDYMPAICVSYPRLQLQSDSHAIQSLACSCPAVIEQLKTASLAELMGPAGLFQTSAKQLTAATIPNYLYHWMRELLLQQHYPLRLRLAALIGTLADMEDAAAQGQLTLERIVQLTGESGTRLKQLEAQRPGLEQALATPAMGAFLKFIYKVSLNRWPSRQVDTNSPLHEQLYSDEDSENHLVATAQLAMQQARRLSAALQPHLSVLEKFVALQLVNRGFPWNSPEGNPFTALLDALAPYPLAMLTLYTSQPDNNAVDSGTLYIHLSQAVRRTGHGDALRQAMAEQPAMFRLAPFALLPLLTP